MHQAFHVATSGRPGPVLVDIPKDVQFANGNYINPAKADKGHYSPRVKGDIEQITALVNLIENAEKPIIYSGGGVINSGPAASALLRELAASESGEPNHRVQHENSKNIVDESSEVVQLILNLRR